MSEPRKSISGRGVRSRISLAVSCLVVLPALAGAEDAVPAKPDPAGFLRGLLGGGDPAGSAPAPGEADRAPEGAVPAGKAVYIARGASPTRPSTASSASGRAGTRTSATGCSIRDLQEDLTRSRIDSARLREVADAGLRDEARSGGGAARARAERWRVARRSRGVALHHGLATALGGGWRARVHGQDRPRGHGPRGPRRTPGA